MIATMTRTTNIRHGRHLFLFLLPTFFLPHFALVGGIRRAPPLTVQEELGISPTLSLFLADKAFFDPLNIATDDNFAFLREVELKHGRVSMMATIGMLVNGWPVVSATLTNENVFLHQQVPDSILLKTSWIDVTKVMIVCAVLETQVLYQQDPQDMPGDYGVGYWFSRDKARHERSLVSELENGRLAMLAFFVQIVYEVVTGKNCLGFLVDLWTMVNYSSSPASEILTS